MSAGEKAPFPGGWLYDLNPVSLEKHLVAMGMPAYAASQVFHWLYQRREPDISNWTNISRAHRKVLDETFFTSLPLVENESRDGSGARKVLLRLHDGKGVEAVWIPGTGRSTLCISTQVGCAMGCSFCATGAMGFHRSLSMGEILAQVLVLLGFQLEADERFNIVLMGMGEPLLNPQAVMGALAVMTADPGMRIPSRHITLSTVGLLTPLAELEQRFPRVKISLSLHAADDAVRKRLMPKAASLHSIGELLDYFARPRHYPVTFEYVLIRGVNASRAQARLLAARLRTIRGKVNLIPLNPVPGCSFSAPALMEENAFLRVLVDAGLSVTVRRSRGKDIQSACGQLAVEVSGKA
ncbi:MAG TPA: 23S rRNA (adenine(2503)-C(2))-methyltransferase RlmN [Candidatus Aminicenantes bacterium]|nr:23S rRNA (adenine(2503)-C(2))-methyltransferase RlmN [Candidatus Aminicenantes bacterium]